jgi:uncharacterized protein (DUF58 family)
MSTAFRAKLRPSPGEAASATKPGFAGIVSQNLRLFRAGFERLGRFSRTLRLRLQSRLQPGLAWVREHLAPWVEPISTLGWGVLAVGLVSLAVALWLGWAELLAVAVVLGGCLLIAVASVLGRPSYLVKVSLASLRVVVGERAAGELVVRNVATRTAKPSLIELPVGARAAFIPIPRLDPEAEHDQLFTIPTQRRAILQLGPARSIQQDPLQLLRRQIRWTEPEEIYVHPRTVRLENASTGFVRDLEGLPTRDLSNDDVSFHALREYQPGDDLRYVHWRSTARVGKLMIRQFEETRRSQLVVILSTKLEDYRDEDEFELGISIAASLARSAQREGKAVAVYTSDRQLTTLTPDRLLDGFSGVEPSHARQTYPERVRGVAADNPGASVVALVTGSVPSPREVHLASLRVPLMARCYGARAAMAEDLGRKALGTLSIITVPQLENLPLGFRAVA